MGSTISGNLPIQPVQSPVALPTTASQAGPTVLPSMTTPAATASVSGQDASAAPQLEQKLSEALKSTGFKAEVDTSTPGETVVRIVDDVTGKLVIQMPSANALIIAEALRKGTLEQDPPETGSLLDEAA